MIQRRSDSRQPPQDQADGLRRLFAGPRQHVLPLVANPFVPASGAGSRWRRLRWWPAAGRCWWSTRPAARRAARDRAVRPGRQHRAPCRRVWATWPRAACRWPMSTRRGSAAAFIDAIAAAAPQADVVLLHADPSDLARLLAGRPARPVLLGADRLEAVKQAYAGCKLLVQRCRPASFDLLLSARTGSRQDAASRQPGRLRRHLSWRARGARRRRSTRWPTPAATTRRCSPVAGGAVALDDPHTSAAWPRELPAGRRRAARQADTTAEP
jgi:hypothetical protein